MGRFRNVYVCFTVVFIAFNAQAKCEKPNFVIFITDDQDLTLDGMKPMKSVQNFIANKGAVFVNSYAASPICCPSRASILSGRYQHNHGTVNNSIAGGCYSDSWRKIENKTYAAILKEQGDYETFYAGKYLNQYGEKAAGGPSIVPTGWSHWHGLVGNSRYYNYTLSHNGVPQFYGDKYLTDVINDLALDFLLYNSSKPFLMVLAPPSPHQPFTPAPRHQGVFKDVTVKRTPHFNIVPKDKHWLMRMPPSPLPEDMIPELDQVFRSRWESLLAVDQMVANVVHGLAEKGVLEKTYLVYTSDNGYHIGQFSQVYDKRQPYESDIAVPLVISGPGIQSKTLIHEPTINIDLAPTIVSLAGLSPPASMDGRSVDQFLFAQKSEKDLALKTPEFEDRQMLIEYHGEGSKETIDAACPWKFDGNMSECYPQYACKCQDSVNNTYACVRHLHPKINFKYCSFQDTEQFEEAYDLATDPYELTNIIDNLLPSIKYRYRSTLQQLLQCQGQRSCRVAH